MMDVTLSRRQFFKLSMTASGGLVLATQLSACGTDTHSGEKNGVWHADAWVKMDAEGQVKFLLDRVEMGQGTYTGLTTLLAEELDIDPSLIEVQFAPADTRYRNPDYGLQITGGSNSLSSSWDQIRQSGAAVRAVMTQAAGRVWQVAPEECSTMDGRVVHAATQRSLNYSDLYAVAVKESVPNSLTLKDPADFKYIGKHNQRLDAPLKSTGTADFGIDTVVPGMAFAVVSRCPVIGGSVKHFDATAALASAGVKQVVEITSGIAVIADSYWQARKGLNALSVEWDEGENASLSTQAVFEQYKQMADQDEGDSRRDEGDIESALSNGDLVISAEYQAPFLAHATMEPQNCVAHVQADRCDIWAPTQGPDVAQVAAAKVTDLSLDQIFVHTTFIGGGFGRRLSQDFVAEAAEISAKTGLPIKLIWSREDDTQHDIYRPASYHRLKAAVSADGKLTGWQHQLVCPKILSWYVWDAAPAQFPWAPKFMYNTLANAGIAGEGVLAPEDHSPFEGAESYPYAVESVDVRYTHADAGVPVSYWRSVGHSQNAFVVEGFMNEMAHAAKQDPYQFRRNLLKDNAQAVAVLDKVVALANWGKAPKGVHQGLALHYSFGSWVAQVVEVAVEGTQYQVNRVYCVIDCGLAVNPDIVHSQMESGVIFALTAAKYGQIDIEQGRVKQSNFHDYQMLRMNECPEIVIDIIPSAQPPKGVGEPGVPPLAPALADALFSATGKRLRELPLSLS
ncbi:xanthine dehydrogenase family protein molybdopterin-binding subunit [Litoribacillus peritrichatus]|uniref:Xanthine dehydrogenase family protein molybdopterin-binding subunit n=1 Tax=Litoribacillus peritrichatus TaxID=718191 RepID=A0ABP7M4M3_9GAMM